MKLLKYLFMVLCLSIWAFGEMNGALPNHPSSTATAGETAASSAKSFTARTETLDGWVVDEVCGRVTGRTSEHATCARMCSRMTHKTLVFVSDYNGVNIAVSNPGVLRPYLGKHLDIKAKVTAPKEIRVLHVDRKSASAPPNDPVAAHDNAPLIPTPEWQKPVWAESTGQTGGKANK